MGLPLEIIDLGGKPFLLTEPGVIYIVGRRHPRSSNPDVDGYQWHLQGVATDRRLAEAMCRDREYFVGPPPVNCALPHDTIQWVGLYFPLRQKENDGD